jgi:hypothetical protein
MIGQLKLKSKIDSYTLSTFPHSILLTGDRGSEKDEICEYISDRFNFPRYEITELISEEYIEEIYSSPTFGLYIIDGTKITEKEQNILLKVYEEPNPYMYLILTCESKYNILETIQTRSYELVMDIYTRDELLPLCKKDIELELRLANTPGTVEELNQVDLPCLKKLCSTILEKINIAAYQNTLTISDKINFKDEYDKYPLWAFIRMLSLVMLEEKSPLYWYLLDFTKKVEPLLDKKRFFENLLTKMWLEVHNGH